ncbi:MAG: hypothetical protein JO267_00250 [Alphaproteobacteria bacterium]|nr:hypothetical protein [Alphaproteobacteria bacterium]
MGEGVCSGGHVRRWQRELAVCPALRFTMAWLGLLGCLLVFGCQSGQGTSDNDRQGGGFYGGVSGGVTRP